MRKSLPGLAILFMLALPGLLYLGGVRPQTTENRAPAAFPTPNRSDLWTGDYWDEFEVSITDRLPIRPQATAVNTEAIVRTLRDSPNPDVTIGNDGAFYFTPAIDQLCFAPVADEFAASVERAGLVAESVGKEVWVLVAPDKATINAAEIGTDNCLKQSRTAIDAHVNPVPNGLYPATALELATEAGNPPPYHRWDTHWNAYGSAIAAQGLIAMIAPGTWDPDDVVFDGTVDYQGDLAGLLGINRNDLAPVVKVSRPGVTTTEEPGPPIVNSAGDEIRGAGGFIFSSESASEALLEGNTLLLHDSFGWALIPHLSPYFAALRTVRYEWIDSNTANLVADADRIIVEWVQRSSRERYEQSPLDEAIVTAVASELDELPHEIKATGTDNELVVIADLPEGCEGAYLVVNRRVIENQDAAVNGRTVAKPGMFLPSFWSSDGEWTVGGLVTDSPEVAVSVKALCAP